MLGWKKQKSISKGNIKVLNIVISEDERALKRGKNKDGKKLSSGDKLNAQKDLKKHKSDLKREKSDINFATKREKKERVQLKEDKRKTKEILANLRNRRAKCNKIKRQLKKVQG